MWVGILTGGVIGLLAVGLVGRGIIDLRDWYAVRSVAAEEEPGEGAVGGTAGPTALAGDARPVSGTVESPFTGRPCLAYAYRVRGEHVEADPDHPGSGWDELGDGDGGVELLVEGAGETLLVDPAAVSVELSTTPETITVPSAQEPPERVQEFLATVDGVPREQPSIDGPLAERTGRRQYQEWILEPGDRAFVTGVAHPRSRVDEALPRAADGKLESDGESGLTGRFRSLPTVLSDQQPDDFTTSRFRRALGFVGVGLTLGAAAVLVGWPV